MSARPQQIGRAAAVRNVLGRFPQGATVEQIKAAGHINASNQAISYTLSGLARSGQAMCHRSGVRGIWRLASHVQHAIAPLRAPPARDRSAVGQLTGVSDAATTIRHREVDRQQLAEDVDAFLAAGGQIEVLGHTPLRPAMGRHAANYGGYAERMLAHDPH
ncbi:hypothetical protein [Stenotrophomonas indicatrix]|uniref:hypothetical protein n=1 Tax=Stenotrophomonas indicatrix TaxID=2045451 RepID=UPI002004AB1B|nr:hypothetical protein [Stenotrophomonas indicatrix]MCK6230993.1 hypothetical protein [Stenotrophomonas indicatrix]